MASPIHSILPRLAMVVMPLLLGGISYAVYHRLARRYDVPNGSDIFRAVEGKWAQSGLRGNCDTNWVTLRFTPNHAELMLAYPHPTLREDGKLDSIFRYPLLGHTRHSLRVVRRNETILNPDSTPVVWELMLRSPNTYAWHRSDWLPVMFTQAFKRCPP